MDKILLQDVGSEIISDATEAIQIKDDMIELGFSSKAIDYICADLEQAIKIIRNSGIKGYIYMVDRNDAMADRFDIPKYETGLSVEALKECENTHLNAAIEGLEEYLTRFVELIKTIIEKLKSWCQTILSFRKFHLDYISKNLERLSMLQPDTKVGGVMGYKDASKLLNAIEEVHKYVKSIPDNPNTQVSQNGNLLKVMTDLCLKYEPGEDGTFYVNNAEVGIAERYPIKELCTLTEAGWSASSAKDFAKKLTQQDSQKQFKEIIATAERHGKYVSEFQIDVVKQAKEPKRDSTSAAMVRSHGSVVRMLSKFATTEHQAVLHCCKTARGLISVTPPLK